MSSSDMSRFLERAVALHQAGDLAPAEELYRQILIRQPQNFDALHLLGVLACQRQDLELSIRMIKAALSVNSTSAPAFTNLAVALRGLGRHEEAIKALDRAVDLAPNSFAALQLRGSIWRIQARPEVALADYDRALAIKPGDIDTIGNRAAVLLDLDRVEEALVGFDLALSAKSDYAELHYNRGVCLQRLNRHESAIGAYDRALSIKADYVAALSNKAAALIALNKCEEALCTSDMALAISPYDVETLNNKALALGTLGLAEQAESLYRTILELVPTHGRARLNLAHLLLVAGRLEEGWQHYEWRHAMLGRPGDSLGKPCWGGEPLNDRVLLVRAEQGYGDTIQFCRYLSLIGKTTHVIVEVPVALERLAMRIPGVQQAVVQGRPLPHFDVYCPMLSLPGIVGTTLESIPAEVPYLSSVPADRAAWRSRLALLTGLRVGLVWAGRSNSGRFDEKAVVDVARSVTLDLLAPLAGVEEVSFVSLQTGEPAAQARQPPKGMLLHDFTDQLSDFADTAALIDCLDLVISVDTAVAHLAGAMGKPIWLLNRHDTCWRWLLERHDSPWYPTMRIFRQTSPGDWTSVLAAVTAELGAYVRAARGDI